MEQTKEKVRCFFQEVRGGLRKNTGDAAGRFSVNDFLREVGDDRLSNEHLSTLLKLCRKLEIARRLSAFYHHDSRLTADPDAPDADPAAVQALLLLCILAYCQGGNLRYLNTVYKVYDPGLGPINNVQLDDRISRICDDLLCSQA